MKIVPLVPRGARESIATLEYLLRMARAGRIRGLALCAKDDENIEHIIFSGDYQDDPAKAVNAAMRMCWRMTQIQEEADVRH